MVVGIAPGEKPGMRRDALWIIVTLAPVSLCGCSRSADSGAPDKPGGRSSASSTSAGAAAKTTPGPAISLFDGFEGDSLAPFWRPGNYGDGRYAPGAVVISKDYARAGTRSVRITVREGDIVQVGDDGLRTERAELDSGRHPFVGRDVWYGFSVLIPPGFPVIDNRLVIAQWKQSGVSGSPLVAQRFRNGKHELTIRTPVRPSGRFERFTLPKIEFGKWNDMIYHTRFSSRSDGLVEVWMNGARVVEYKAATAFKNGEDLIYNKIGLYRDRWKEPMTIYFDNYAIGDSFAAVDPSAQR
jgi:hypothetical protein